MGDHETVRCCGCDVQLCNDANCADWRHTGRPWIVDGFAWCDECSAGPRLAVALAEVDRLTAQLAAEQDKRRAADAVLAEIGGWCLTHGAALKPGGGDADTFGDGMRAAKDQIRRVLLRNLNPNAGEPRE